MTKTNLAELKALAEKAVAAQQVFGLPHREIAIKSSILALQFATDPETILALVKEIEEKTIFIESIVDKYFDLKPSERMGPKSLRESEESLRARTVLTKWSRSG